MDKQPVGQLPDLTQSNNDDEIMVITNSEYNQLKKEKISDFITDLTSTDENNAIVKGTDGKLFTKDFGNASNITEGTLPVSVLPDIPKSKLPVIETTDLPESGVAADTYAYPSSVTVNAQGMVTAIEEGSPGANNANQDLSNLSERGEKHFANPDLSNLSSTGQAILDSKLNQTQITNCILEAPNGVATYSDTTITLKQGLKVLIPNGRNADKTLKNIEYTVPEDKTINYTGIGAVTYDFILLYGNTGGWALSQNYQEVDTPPTFYGNAQYYLNTKENIMYFNYNNERWEPATVAVLGKGKLENGVVTSFIPYQPVELAKRTDPQIQAPYITETYQNGTSGYRVWSDGYCEQWGVTNVPRDSNTTVTLLKPYKNTNYVTFATLRSSTFNTGDDAGVGAIPSSVSQFILRNAVAATTDVQWVARGYVN